MNDKQVHTLIKKEEKRQNETLDFIASENSVSSDVLFALGSRLTNKYAEGYPHARYYGGNEFIDQIEELVQKRALKLFKISDKKWSVNVQPYSGSPANLAVYHALVPLGEKIMGMSLDMGGHLTHGHKASVTGKVWCQVPYGVSKKTGEIDYPELMKIAKRENPKLIIAGGSAYPRKINFKEFRRVADACGALLMVDMSHFAGLVAGGAHPSPFPYADIVTTTTHKTLRGPRAAVIFSKIELMKAINKAVFPGLQGGPHINAIASVGVALKEADSKAFKVYAVQVVKNAKVLGEELKKRGWDIVSGKTETHLLLVNTMSKGISGGEASEKLERVGIVANKNMLPYDERKPNDPSGVRLGAATLTTRGMKEKEMKIVAELISATLLGEKSIKEIKTQVLRLCRKFPIKK